MILGRIKGRITTTNFSFMVTGDPKKFEYVQVMHHDKEVEYVEEILKTPVPDLQTGAFLHHLDQDKIEGVTKNTEGWLENFRGLTTVK